VRVHAAFDARISSRRMACARRFAGDAREANLGRSDEAIDTVAENDTRMIRQAQHRNNRHVQFQRVPLAPTRLSRMQIAEVVDDFRGAPGLTCTSFDQVASTANSNIAAIKLA
jgi:hypothetical protein